MKTLRNSYYICYICLHYLSGRPLDQKLFELTRNMQVCLNYLLALDLRYFVHTSLGSPETSLIIRDFSETDRSTSTFRQCVVLHILRYVNICIWNFVFIEHHLA